MIQQRQSRVNQLQPDFAQRLSRKMKARIDKRKAAKTESLAAAKRGQAMEELSSMRRTMGLSTQRLLDDASTKTSRCSLRPDSKEKSVRFDLTDVQQLDRCKQEGHTLCGELGGPDANESSGGQHRPRSKERSSRNGSRKSFEDARPCSRESTRSENSRPSFEPRPVSRESDTIVSSRERHYRRGNSEPRSGAGSSGSGKPPLSGKGHRHHEVPDMESRYSTLKNRVSASLEDELRVSSKSRPHCIGGDGSADDEGLAMSSKKGSLGPVRVRGAKPSITPDGY
jgi:hypothetical protein